MLKRISQLRAAINTICLENKNITEFLTNEWRMINAYVKVFDSLKNATKVMEADKYVTSSWYLPLVYGFDGAFKPTENNLVEDSLTSRFEYAKSNKFLIAAMMLDPRFKGSLIHEDLYTLNNYTNIVKDFMIDYCKKVRQEENDESQDEDTHSMPKRKKCQVK